MVAMQSPKLVAGIVILLLSFLGPCVVSVFQYISNKMQLYTVNLCLETALHVSGGKSTHHQEHTQLYLQHLVLVKPLCVLLMMGGLTTRNM